MQSKQKKRKQQESKQKTIKQENRNIEERKPKAGSLRRLKKLINLQLDYLGGKKDTNYQDQE